MSQSGLEIPGTNIVVLEALAENAGVDMVTFIGQSIGLGLNLADITIDAGCSGVLLLQQPDGHYDKHAIDFSADDTKPVPSADMAEFERDLAYVPSYELDLAPPVLEVIEETAGLLATTKTDFIEAAISLRHLWALTRRHGGEILIDDRQDGSSSYIVAEDDAAFFRYDL